MKCQECNSETYIDHVEVNGNITKYAYVCVNPKCSEYRKAKTLTGGGVETRIKIKEESPA